MRATKLLASLVLISFWVPIPAAAQDFLITVPAQFSKVPSNVKTFAATCEVEGPGAVFNGRASSVPVGKGTTGPQAVPAGGAYSGDLKVPVTVNPGKDRTKVDGYHCWLWFTAVDASNGASVDYFRWDDPTLGANPPRPFPTTPGAPLVTDLRGAIQP